MIHNNFFVIECFTTFGCKIFNNLFCKKNHFVDIFEKSIQIEKNTLI